MSIDDFVKLIQGVGFPAAIAFFVLWRLDGSMHEMIREVRFLRMVLLKRFKLPEKQNDQEDS